MGAFENLEYSTPQKDSYMHIVSWTSLLLQRTDTDFG